MLRIVFNGSAITAQLRAAQEQIADAEPMHRDIGEYLIDSHRQRFQRGEAPDGSAWAPKSLVTIERYRRMGDGDRTKPLIGPSRRLSTELHYFASKAETEVGSNLEYAAVMQEGAAKGAFGADRHGRPIPWGNIPARVWLGLSDIDERNILDIVDEHLGDALEE
ncbi:phage virion morphogenesis protein [Sphingomonas sp.]|uniref:phage virion morphogenesis protein n=1 Tax=Sphingomonas sp. TaxID=28214 RepID=UPI00307EAAD0